MRPGRLLLWILAAILVPLALALGWRALFVNEPAVPATLPVPLDTSAFDGAIEALAPERAARLDALTAGLGLAGLVDALAGGEASASELVAFSARRVRAHDPILGAVIALDPAALAEAARLDALAAEGRSAGPLHGVPVLVKDNVATGGGLATTVGAAALAGHRPPADAPVVARLREAGAVILGKTNLSEWAYFMSTRAPSGYSAVGGPTVNPFGRDLAVLGSSSGSAVAVAARFAPLALGTETTGSIVAPAAANGIAGMRPSTGLLDDALIAPIATALDGAGPMARRVADLALALDVLAGPGHGFVAALDGALDGAPSSTATLEGVRLGMPVVGGLRPGTVGGEPFGAAVAALEAAGATVVEAIVPDAAAQALAAAQLPLFAGRMARDTDAWLAATGAPIDSLADVVAWNARDPDALAPHGQDLLELTVAARTTDDEHAELVARYRSTALGAIESLAREHGLDALLSVDNLFSLFYAGAGVAAVVLPIGRDASGQPRGATLVAVRPDDDAALLRLAHAVERVAGRLEDPLAGR